MKEVETSSTNWDTTGAITERSEYEEEVLDRVCYRGATNRQIIELVEASRSVEAVLDAARTEGDIEYVDDPPGRLRGAHLRLQRALKRCGGIKA